MAIHGIEVSATVAEATPITEHEAERIYRSLESNFAIKSIDMLADFDANALTFLFGAEWPAFCENTDEFVREVIGDALAKAFARGDDSTPLTPAFTETRIGAFA